MPKVSIITVCYNYGRFLREAIDSVFAQTYKDYELIVIDNGSSDDSSSIALEYPITLIRLPKNTRAAGGRNTGIKLAKGEWIGYLDADDIWEPTYLERVMEKTGKDVGIVRTEWTMFGVTNGVFKLDPDVSPERFFENNLIPYGALFRKEAWENVGGFNEDPECLLEDWDFWLRLVFKGYKVATINEPLWRHRMHKDSIMHSDDKIIEKGRKYLNEKYKHLKYVGK